MTLNSTFRLKKNAQKRAKKLREMGYSARVVQAKSSTGKKIGWSVYSARK